MEGQAEFLARAVRDTLDSVVSPAVRESLLSEALTLAGEAEIPRATDSFRAFMENGLRRVLARALGRELGHSVIAELERLMEPLESSASAPPRRPLESTQSQGGRSRPGERRKVASAEPKSGPLGARPVSARTLPAAAGDSEAPETPRARRSPSEVQRARMAPTVPPRLHSSQPRPPASADYPSGMSRALGLTQSSLPPGGTQSRPPLPIVFLASEDAELVRRFGAWLDPRASVVRVSRLTDLLLDIKHAGNRRTVVVLDGAMPPIRIESVAALSDEFPRSLRIVLWGGPRELTTRLGVLFPRVAEWIVCSDEAALSDLVDFCAEIKR